MKEIPLSKGQVALVDDADYEWLSKRRWHVDSDGYAVGWDGNTKTKMHRIIVGAEKNEQVDHINRNRLDNQRTNLRRCTQEDNHKNIRHSPRGTSRFKGVHWDKEHRKWRVSLSVDTRILFVGRFDDEIAAAKAYDVAARHYHGEFATLNFECIEF